MAEFANALRLRRLTRRTDPNLPAFSAQWIQEELRVIRHSFRLGTARNQCLHESRLFCYGPVSGVAHRRFCPPAPNGGFLTRLAPTGAFLIPRPLVEEPHFTRATVQQHPRHSSP